MHDAQVRTFSALDRRWHLLVVDFPLRDAHGNVYVLLLRVELVHQLPHVVPIRTGEPVPEDEINLWPIVRLAAATGLLQVAGRRAAARQREPRAGPGAQEQEILPRQLAAQRSTPTHVSSFCIAGLCHASPVTIRILTQVNSASTPGQV